MFENFAGGNGVSMFEMLKNDLSNAWVDETPVSCEICAKGFHMETPLNIETEVGDGENISVGVYDTKFYIDRSKVVKIDMSIDDSVKVYTIDFVENLKVVLAFYGRLN